MKFPEPVMLCVIIMVKNELIIIAAGALYTVILVSEFSRN